MTNFDVNKNKKLFLSPNQVFKRGNNKLIFSSFHKKIKRAVTDSGITIEFDESRPGLANLLNIYSALSGESIKDIENKFKGRMYSDFKEDLAEIVVESLSPIQTKYNELINDKSYLGDILSKGSERASQIAYKTIRKVYKKSGLIQ